MTALGPANANELAEAIDTLRAELQANPEAWENASLEGYLEALAAVLRDHQGNLIGKPGDDAIPYADLAQLLRTAAIYE